MKKIVLFIDEQKMCSGFWEESGASQTVYLDGNEQFQFDPALLKRVFRNLQWNPQEDTYQFAVACDRKLSDIAFPEVKHPAEWSKETLASILQNIDFPRCWEVNGTPVTGYEKLLPVNPKSRKETVYVYTAPPFQFPTLKAAENATPLSEVMRQISQQNCTEGAQAVSPEQLVEQSSHSITEVLQEIAQESSN